MWSWMRKKKTVWRTIVVRLIDDPKSIWISSNSDFLIENDSHPKIGDRAKDFTHFVSTRNTSFYNNSRNENHLRHDQRVCPSKTEPLSNKRTFDSLSLLPKAKTDDEISFFWVSVAYTRKHNAKHEESNFSVLIESNIHDESLNLEFCLIFVFSHFHKLCSPYVVHHRKKEKSISKSLWFEMGSPIPSNCHLTPVK